MKPQHLRAEEFLEPRAFEEMHGHSAAVLWLTGLSASGKSTLARRVQQKLFEQGKFVVVLDGDNLRSGINADLGFSPEDRVENIRRVREISKLFFNHGAIVISSFISPYREDRERARDLFPKGSFFEVHLHCELEVCKQRDPKGLYQKALAGSIPQFTGVSAPYEVPLDPELRVRTDLLSVDESAEAVLQLLQQKDAS